MSDGKVIPLRRRPAVEDREQVSDAEQLSDGALLAACASGDTAALGLLFDRHHRGVYAFLSRLAGTDQRDVDDFVQATFLEAMRSAKRYRGDAPVHRWLFGIAAHIVSHHVRSEIRRKAVLVRMMEQPQLAIEPGALVERQLLLEAVQRAVAALPHRQRVVYVMCELEEMPGVEVAHVLGMREGTVWRLLYQARVALRVAVERGT